MALPPNLALGDIIGEPWVDAVVAELTDLAAPSVRYPPKPSAGVVYGINHYVAMLSANTLAPQGAAIAVITIAMPSAPAGTLLDISLTVYMNCAVGHGSAFLSARVNGVSQPPTVVVTDENALRTYSGRIVNVAAPVGVPYNIDLMAAKTNAGGTAQLQGGSNTLLTVVSYRP